MSKIDTLSTAAQEDLNSQTDVENPETKSPHLLTRRSFLSRAGVSSIVLTAAGAATPSLLATKAEADVDGPARSDRSFQLRFNAAARERNVTIPPHTNNGDETRYANFIGNYSQGLPHNSIGEVEPSAYEALLTVVNSGKPSDFANIPLGGTVKLSGP